MGGSHLKTAVAAILLATAAHGGGIRVECESFARLGGWTVETQSTRQIGSSYVMAHGFGTPVQDAETEIVDVA